MSTETTYSTNELPEKSRSFKTLVNNFKIGGIVGIIFGLIHFWSIFSQGFTSIRFGDALINTLLGITFLVCSWLLSKGKVVVIWVFISLILATMVYSYAIGQGFNFVSAILGVGFSWELLSLKNKGEIS